MTIRALGVVLGLLLLSGCATSGPNHVYVTVESDAAVHDVGPEPRELPNIVAPGERVLGLAYDFNTDHLFLRIAPAQVIRVIERPSGKTLREMMLSAELKTESTADLAIRSSDRHIFAVHPDGRSVVELALFGEFLRRIELPGLDAPIGGLAFDQKQQQLLVLTTSSPARIVRVSANGTSTSTVNLNTAVHAVTLGYDSDAQHFFVPLADGHTIGEFDATGAQVGTLPFPATGPVTALDAGPRSFLRVF